MNPLTYWMVFAPFGIPLIETLRESQAEAWDALGSDWPTKREVGYTCRRVVIREYRP